jgi:hypothetical protein
MISRTAEGPDDRIIIMPVGVVGNPLLPVGDLLHGPRHEWGGNPIVEQIEAVDLLLYHFTASKYFFPAGAGNPCFVYSYISNSIENKL